MTWRERIMAGARAFSKAYFSQDKDTWDSFIARKSRYGIYTGFYDSDVYDAIHSYAANLKVQYGLYKSIRAIASPASTIVAHFRDHIWAGMLDAKAGDEGAVPIFTETESLRPIIADIWKWSQWSKNKNLLVTTGTICGDVGIRVIDDISRKKVYLEVLGPSMVKDVELDPFGNVKAYTLEYDIELEDATVTYKEEVTRDGQYVVYKTYKNDSPFAYPDNIDRTGEAKQEWREAYGFVPMVWINHIDVGNFYGQSELFAGLSKFREVDDISSLLSDQVRKTIQPLWLFTGTTAKKMDFPASTGTTSRPEPGREQAAAAYTSDTDVSVEALVAKLDIEGVLEHIRQINQSLKKEYPELVIHDQQVEQGLLSGRALRLARQPAEARVIERRNNYDTGLKNALMMAISIGGLRGIYPGIDLDSYEKGNLEFNISERPVYVLDPEDKSEVDKKFYETAKAAVEAGIDLKGWLQLQGMTEEEISLLTPTVITEEVNDDL